MMMFLETVQQSPTALVLAILRQDLPDNLRVLQQAQIKQGDWRVQFRIIGESHAITVTQGETLCWHEVLACIDLSAQDCTHYQPFKQLQAHEYRADFLPDVAYAVQVNFEPTPTWEAPPKNAPKIEFAFPQVGALTPVTRIQWHLDGDTLTWWTLHTYPQAGDVTYVHSRSQITLTG